ncbi:hypothetical protein [Nitrosospira briensis]|nr:hypothetical protein [Nitrosospira briensis]
MKTIKLLLPLLLLLPIISTASEKAVYVGGGRYACDSDSTDCAVLKQRNEERTRREQERYENERQYEREERREAEYLQDYERREY